MTKKSVPKIEVRRAERQDISTLVEMRIALLEEVGNARSKSDAQDLKGAIRRTFTGNCRPDDMWHLSEGLRAKR